MLQLSCILTRAFERSHMPPVPVILITGFLGSGKTTFLNWLIETHPAKKVSVILNEFGNMKLESQFLQKRDDDVIELANGCMCCVAKSDIPRIIAFILDKSPNTEYILIEASGLSDPDPIEEALQNSSIEGKIYLDGIVCIVDALNFEATRLQHPIVVSQVGDADLVLISKTQETERKTVDRVVTQLRSLIPNISLFEINSELNPNLFLDSTRRLSDSARAVPAQVAGHAHIHEPVQTYIFETEKEIDLVKMLAAVRSFPTSILRAKGSFFDEKRGKHILLQFVAGRVECKEEDIRIGKREKNTLLCIGQDFDEHEVARLLKGCVT